MAITALVNGANGGIGLALTQRWLSQGRQVVAVSHNASAELQQLTLQHPDLRLYTTASKGNYQGFARWLNQQQLKPSQLVSCCGLLHQGSHSPEKQLRQLTESFLLDNIRANCHSAISMAQELEQLYQRKDTFRFGVLSAKVGSIGDNRLGGWYSYRISKAALNMFVRTLSIEWRRNLPNACVVAIHPGTTDTALSQPFQRNIPANKLYSTGLTAERIGQLMDRVGLINSGEFFGWDGDPLPW
ncbi:SDR family NAD(P)-dependent oxidoreductase [Motiliproteus coralliicola]|uniref:SDR family NAD(P)-dependent oxidoreductase n=1 Tax=Motiliproteus coralliicola TaxID=2283196 RepID=A0A369WBW8_9GAMM|nr:SDR family NAD(P)-dependent oxidoreductase [Motiliproteus coralliicola]RDE19518.1 SDR family NAD(P)-dependent oxidoreductase [Motiliproteus coralliicola]